MKREPLVTAAFVLSAIGAILALLKAFGVALTNEQQAAISGFASVVAPLLVAVLVRPKVTPVATSTDEGGATATEVALLVIAVGVGVLALVALFGRP